MEDPSSATNPASSGPNYARLAEDPRYQELVRRRFRIEAALTAVMLVAYFGFILLVAFNKALLARPIGGGATSFGIPIGLGVILLAIALTGAYVLIANRLFDADLRAIREEYGA